jgi:hypothetical protein
VIDDGELSEPKDNREKDGALLLRNEVIPIIHGLSGRIQVQIHALGQFLDGLVTALVVLELTPEDTLEGYAETVADLDHRIRVQLIALQHFSL